MSKAGSRLQQPTHPVSYPEAKTLIKSRFRQKWREERNLSDEKDSIQDLDRGQQTIIFRLRTGHCRLLHHLYRLRISHTPTCPCETGIQDPEHVLQSCPTYTRERTTIWPEATDVKQKLWGAAHELRRTAQFIRNTSIDL